MSPYAFAICQSCRSQPAKGRRNAGSLWNINKAQWRKQGSRRHFLFQNHPGVPPSSSEAAVTQGKCYYYNQAAAFTCFLHVNNSRTHSRPSVNRPLALSAAAWLNKTTDFRGFFSVMNPFFFVCKESVAQKTGLFWCRSRSALMKVFVVTCLAGVRFGPNICCGH